ncbi:hypothetical protein JIG36_24890 [Actinoplanes sp. LDG1-06]|uniref:Uncharacterized protein n=1 Tax=Paractinoplanes ovalisporus TaxID=2810368 RepID=A0ABS2AG88_9ACTN|nr:hypothetical protein [Actinoplanes ovalisporus]MBM2618800.1 hypothetical protein [Actinoplanes ovalisporus]
MLTEVLSDYGAVTLALGLAGAATGLARTCIAHRTRRLEQREMSARTAARMTGWAGLAGTHHEVVRISERDRDGQREVELNRRKQPVVTGNEETA